MPEPTDDKPEANVAPEPAPFRTVNAADNPIDKDGKTARDREREQGAVVGKQSSPEHPADQAQNDGTAGAHSDPGEQMQPQSGETANVDDLHRKAGEGGL